MNSTSNRSVYEEIDEDIDSSQSDSDDNQIA
jgi:hypothetical protein